MNTLRNLGRRKLRSALTISGISIGVVALVVFGAMANEINRFVSANVDYLRGEIVVTTASATHRLTQPIAPSAIDAVRHLAGAAEVVPSVQLTMDTTDSVTISLLPDTIIGVDPGAVAPPDAYRVGLAQGRELRASDADADVAVVGADIALRKQAHVGGTILLRGEPFTVVGIDQTTTAMPDSEVQIPIAAARRLFMTSLPEQYRTSVSSSEVVTNLAVHPTAGTDTDALAARIVAAHPDLQTMTSSSVGEEIGSVTRIFNAILIGVALISLLVGGLSVINTMAMAIAERTREIGIRRAIGASRSRVIREIVAESSFIGLAGGLGGLALGALIVVAANEAGRSTNTMLFDLSPGTALSSVVFATVLGTIAGLVPAIGAARLDPVAALRYE